MKQTSGPTTKVACCRFRGHDDKIVTLKLEDADEAEVQPRVQAGGGEAGERARHVGRPGLPRLGRRERGTRRWMRELAEAPARAFPGHGQMRSEPAEITVLRKEVARLKAERDILKRRPRSSRGSRHEVRLHREAPPHLAGELAV